jgi:phage-related protein
MANSLRTMRTQINDAETSVVKAENSIDKMNNELEETDDEAKKAGKGLDDVGDKAEKSGGKFEKLGKVAGAAMKALGAAMVAAAAGAVALGKAAIENYADYEQLVGGVDTLFKEGSAKVQEYANNAYKTAGMSANQYMETVTGFSASLISSLGGDGKKAADAANQAITDMSDNANKMGTDIQSIQNAYQGFAKQNYTMLDNLKLGYGGTKEEMQRLLDDAEKLSGVKYDMSNLNDVYEAIHVVQTEMGITGTTAKEAASTISGSMGMAKAAWQNLLTGMADDNANFSGLISDFVDSVVTVASNLIPRIKTVISGLGKLVDGLIKETLPLLLKEIPPLLSELLPVLINSVQGIITGLTAVLPDIINVIVDLIPQIIEAITGLIPTLITAGMEIASAILEGVGDMLPEIILVITNLIPQIVNALVKGVPQIIQGALKLLQGIIKAIPLLITELVPQIPDIITSIVDVLVGSINEIVKASTEMFNGIIEAIPLIITELVPQIPTIITAICNALIKLMPVLLKASLQLFMQFQAAMFEVSKNVINKIPQILSGIIKGFAPLKDAFSNLWNSIKTIFAAVPTWFKTIFSQAWQAVKSVFSGWGDFFKGLWDKIKTTFSTLGTSIASAIGGAVKSGINGVISMIQNTVNSGINLINGAINLINKIPAVSIGKIGALSLPRLAKGGIVDSPTLAEVGEQGREAIIPLENNKGWIKELAAELKSTMLTPLTEFNKEATTVSLTNNMYNEIVTAFKDALSQMKVELDDEELGNFVEKTVADAIYT